MDEALTLYQRVSVMYLTIQRQPHKVVNHLNNSSVICLSVFDHFVGLALK